MKKNKAVSAYPESEIVPFMLSKYSSFFNILDTLPTPCRAGHQSSKNDSLFDHSTMSILASNFKPIVSIMSVLNRNIFKTIIRQCRFQTLNFLIDQSTFQFQSLNFLPTIRQCGFQTLFCDQSFNNVTDKGTVSHKIILTFKFLQK